MSGIIEKLGITPGPWKVYEEEKWPFSLGVETMGRINIISSNRYAYSTRHKGLEDVYSASGFEKEDKKNAIKANAEQKANHLVCSAAPEMLEDGIENCELMRKMYECRFEPDKIEIYFRRMKFASYEKATGKTWDEIKNLL